MRYAGLNENDIAAGPGLCVTFFTQGCPHRCEKCHNPETWDFNGGIEFTPDVIEKIISALTANGIKRNFCIMGGEPLCPENEFLTLLITTEIKKRVPDIKIYLWTGYEYEKIKNKTKKIEGIFENIDVVIDGPYIESLKDLSLPMRGSSNQRIIELTK
jgi:anaerobic ribonucleoside-triphosphate reductase activating protein